MSVSLRGIQASDLEAIHRLQRRAEEHDGIPIVTPIEEFQEWLVDPYLDLEADTRLAESGDRVIGWGRVWHRPSGEREERAYVHGVVDPARRGAGVGSALMRWQLGRAAALLRSAPTNLPRFVRAQAYDFQATALRLFARHSMRPVRWIDELLRDLETVPPRLRVAGLRIVHWDAARSEQARVAQNDAFADHWGSPPRDVAAWRHELASFGTRLDLSFLALDGERVVGVCRNGHFPADEAVNGRRDGWILNVGVVRTQRRRGVASALVIASLEAFKGAEFTHSALGVDSENPTGAYGLYERLGYRPMRRSVVYEIAV